MAVEKAEEAKLRLVSGLATLVYHDDSLKASLRAKESVLSNAANEGEAKVVAVVADLKAFLAA